MPYSASSSNLPANIKKLPEKRRRQWAEVWNSSYEKHKDESRAFAEANAVIRKELSHVSMTLADKAVKVTLFEGHDDKALPAHVKVMPAAVRRRWADNHNYHVSQFLSNPEAQQFADNNTFMSAGEASQMMADANDKEPDMDADDTPNTKELVDGPMSVAAFKATLSSDKRNNLDDSSFAYVDADGKGHLPINDAAHVRNALARFDQTDMPDGAKSGAMAKIRAAAKKFGVDVSAKKSLGATTLDWLVSRVKGRSDMLVPFYVDKSNDQWRVFLVYSNVFEDHAAETISEAAHKEYEAWTEQTGVYPELQLWHGGPASRWGQVDCIAYVDGFAVSSGLVDKGKEPIAEALEAEAKKGSIKVSHGFYGLKDKSGTYLLYRDFEQSPLPASAAANSWTGAAFDVFKEKSVMPFTPAKRQWFKQMAGLDDAKINEWEASLKQAEDALTGAGISRKEVTAGATGEGEGASDPLALVLKEFKSVGESIGQVVTLVTATKQEQDSKITELANAVKAIGEQVKKSQDDLVADAYKAASARGGAPVYVASEQAGAHTAAVAVKEAQAVENDWFGTIVMPAFANAQVQAAATVQVPVPTTGGAGAVSAAANGGS